MNIAGACIFVGLAILALLAFGVPARAQDNPGHRENHDWYRQLKTPGGWSCCNGETATDHGDCRPVHARPAGKDEWEAFYNGGWNPIPKEAILKDELNQQPLTAHICERAGFVYCFLKGGAGT